MKNKLRKIVLWSITLIAVYLDLTAIGMTDYPEILDKYWPIQIGLFLLSTAWITCFMKANGAFDDEEE